MPPQSRGAPQKPPVVPHGVQSRSMPNIPTLKSIEASSGSNTSSATASIAPASMRDEPPSPEPSEAASIEDFLLDDPQSRSLASTDDGDEDDYSDSKSEEDDTQPAHLPPRPSLRAISKSHTHLAPSAFAPPFYNRPPTPLPPSPSLTSLLRPNFSKDNSRPTTPDPSSDEGGTPTTTTHGGTQTPNSILIPSNSKPIPRASPVVPTYEYYGFILYLTSSLSFIVYLLWSFLPSPFLKQMGIHYYPDRWWALAIPAWTVMGVLYIYVALASYNTGYLTLGMGSVECLVDEAANVAVVDGRGNLLHEEQPSWRPKSPPEQRAKKGGRKRQGSAAKPLSQDVEWRSLWSEGTDAVMDIPIGGVCEILYGQRDGDGDSTDVSGNAHDR